MSRKSLRAGAAGNIESGGIPPDKTVKRFKRPTFSVTAYTDVRLFCQYEQRYAPQGNAGSIPARGLADIFRIRRFI